MEPQNKKPTLAYWNFRGLGNPIRLLLAYLEIDYEEKRYSNDMAGLRQWKADRGDLGLDFPNLPYWKDEFIREGLSESRAIMKYLCRTWGKPKELELIPSDPVGLARVEMLEGVVYDTGYLVTKRIIYDDHVIQELNTSGPSKLAEISRFLGEKDWLFGEKIMYVDFILYEVIHLYLTYDSSFIKPHKNLLKFKKRFETIPKIREYMASPKYISSPCAHPLFVTVKI